MPFTICMFCKRSLGEFCYNIYDSDNQGFLNIIQLLGSVEQHLRKDRCLCYECLYVIKWLFFMKKTLLDALLEDDVEDNDQVITAFNIFKQKVNRLIFLLEDDLEQDEKDNSSDSGDFNDNYSSMTAAIDLTNPTNKIQRKSGHRRQSDTKELKSTCLITKVGVANRPQSAFEPSMYSARQETHEQEIVSQNIEFSCRFDVCQLLCNSFQGIKRHYHDDHHLEWNDTFMQVYQQQIQEYQLLSDFDMKLFKFRCLSTECKRHFETLETLTDHKVDEHNFQRQFPCVQCDFNMENEFVSQIDLNYHTFLHHNDNNQHSPNIEPNVTMKTAKFPCLYCDKIFADKNLLKEHFQEHERSRQPTDKDKENFIVKRMQGISSNNAKRINFCENTNIKAGHCSFRVRIQKVQRDVVKDKEVAIMRQIKMKSLSVHNEVVNKIINGPAKTTSKTILSLPPRKRRKYTQIDTSSIQETQFPPIHTPIITPIITNIVKDDTCISGWAAKTVENPEIIDKGTVEISQNVSIEQEVLVAETIDHIVDQTLENAEHPKKDSIFDKITNTCYVKLEKMPETLVPIPKSPKVIVKHLAIEEEEHLLENKETDIATVDEKSLETTTSGRLKMTISLKAIEEYKHKKEKGKEEKHTKRHRKVKNKDKQKVKVRRKHKSPSPSPQMLEISEENLIHLQISDENAFSTQQEQHSFNLMEESSPRENEPEDEHEIVWNIAEINKIILGEQVVNNTQKLTDAPNIDNKLENRNIQPENIGLNIIETNNVLEAEVKCLPAKVRKTRGRKPKGKKRIYHKKQIIQVKKGEDCDNDNVSNAKLKDHLYAKSAFSSLQENGGIQDKYRET